MSGVWDAMVYGSVFRAQVWGIEFRIQDSSEETSGMRFHTVRRSVPVSCVHTAADPKGSPSTPPCLAFRVWGPGFGVRGLGFRVWGLEFGLGAESLGLRVELEVWGLRMRVE